MTTEAQQLLDAAFAGKLDMNAEHQVLGADDGKNAPGEAPKTDDTNVTGGEADKGAPEGKDDEPEGAPIASKSGTYTIPHEKLAKAREEAKTLKAQKDELAQANAALQAKVDELTAAQQQNLAAARAEAAARSESGAAATQADKNLAVATAAANRGVDIAVFGDFSEEGIANGIAYLDAKAEERANARIDARVDEKVAAALKPQAEKAEKDAEAAHNAVIYAKHPDADEIVTSNEFSAWRDRQSTFVRAGIESVFKTGTAADVIEVFDNFKAEFAKGGGAAADAVAKALAGATAKPPQSLSDLPGAAGMSDTETVIALSNDPQKLLDFMNSLPDEKRVRLMNRVT